MNFASTAVQDELAEAALHYLTDRYPPARVAEFAEHGAHDVDAWPELVRQGWLDGDLGLVELALLAQANGTALHPIAWWSTMGAALPAYRAAGLEPPGTVSYGDGSSSCRARHDGATWRLDGHLRQVVDAGYAVELVVAATDGYGPALFTVRTDDPGVTLSAHDGLDPLRGSATVQLAGATGRLLLTGPAADAARVAGQRRAVVLACAEAVGVGQRALAMAIEHAQARVQFDRPIGSFQAVAHRLADSYADLELARSLMYRAAVAVADAEADGASGPTESLDDALACAEVSCPAAAVAACESAVQVFGGIGVTWEFPLHWWYRRALWLQSFHRARTDALATVADALLADSVTHHTTDR
ncbi:acyl-CoA dehydrogenase family protein [Salinispora arenicola]|uniref:acyl-CoA dehydrogenase family protein n=1 Tax=Salinispora arenicola TaxID=168697 RepID=UPI000475B0C7|nr:acyl-CoA dehydrogenase family protein [Salinispora arenicola]